MSFPIPVFGLTGGVASGKSTVSKMFADAGIPVIDADKLARQVFDQPDIQETILGWFGTVDRRKIREIIFADKNAKVDLESIIHPVVHQLAAQRIEELAGKGYKAAIYDAALLVESGYDQKLA